MSTAIEVRDLSKMYRLGQFNTGALSQDFHRWIMLSLGKEDPFQKIGESNDRSAKGNSNIVWSLRDLNFDIQQGDTVGIVGKNGAGKSTLLKLLSRVTSPTTGHIRIKGRVSSLLEVGTGFHPELTGQENIFLNGAILGMKKSEIKEQLEEIVDFAGVARYLDTPVKRYSSGMFVRLGFAVAAHLRSEIMIVDEVLAVGDVDFQDKCLGKMNSLSKGGGKTILFVSHNMGSVSKLCSKSILLENGGLKLSGNTKDVIDSYLDKGQMQGGKIFDEKESRMFVREITAENAEGALESSFSNEEEIVISSILGINQYVSHSEFRLVARDNYGKAIFTSDCVIERTDEEVIEISAKIPSNFLRPGKFVFTVAVFVPHKEIIDLEEDALAIKVYDGGTKYSTSEGLDYGYVFFEPEWSLK